MSYAATAFRRLISVAGYPFPLLSFLGRLPAAMIQLGLLLVAASDFGLTVAGATVAIVGVGTAIGASIVGRSIDRWGPAPVVAAALAVQILALGIILWAVGNHSIHALFIGGFVVGCANPQIGSVARAIWSHAVRKEKDANERVKAVRLAMGFETAADEISFVVGPVAAGALVTLYGPHDAVMVLMIVTALGEGVFLAWLLSHRTGGRHTQSRVAGRSQRLVWSLLGPIFAQIFSVGMVFGSIQTTLTAYHLAQGTPELTGVIYGAMGVTSALAGLLSPAIGRSASAKTLVAGLLVVLGAGVMMTVPSTVLCLVIVLLIGCGAGTTLVTSYALVERLAPAARVTTAMTIGATFLVTGVSTGSATAGYLGDQNLVLSVVPALLAGGAIVGISVAQRLRSVSV